MKEFSVSKFLIDTEIKDDVSISGPSTAHGNFIAYSIALKNDFIVVKDLKTTKGSINAESNLQVGTNLISSSDIIVQKTCKIGGSIEGENIRLLGLKTSAQSIKATTVSLRGILIIQNGITASMSVYLLLNPRKWKVDIGGVIDAPSITISFGGFFTKWSTLSDTLLKRIGKEVRVKKQFNIGNLSIKTNKLTIKTRYPPERVEIDFSNSDIEAKEIEVGQVQ